MEMGTFRGASRAQLWPIVTIFVIVAILYFAREVFLPLAIAVLLTFALAPLVSLVRKVGIPRIPAVIIVVALAVVGIAGFSAVVASQVAELASNLPTYQTNILSKIQSLRGAGSGDGILSRITDAVERVGKEIEKPKEETIEVTPKPKPDPVLVEIYSPTKPIQTLTNMILPLIGPLATAGLVIVVVIFMLLEREDLRDRFIRLVGHDDIHKTTEALQEAGARVGRYLLMQLIVNVAYGVPIAIGLWFIGIPNAILWGLLSIVLRFVPYIGPIIAMVLPLFLAVAVAPDWSLVLWAAGLFIIMELISNNIIEPWLYGSETGLSPLSIIVAAIFWTWIWGPIGLVLSTPLTVCLVVLGKHVPQFQFFEVLFGSEPVLDPKARLYQRLLAGDPDEATDQAEELLEKEHLADFYSKVLIPAMLLAEQDRARGVMNDEQRARIANSAHTLVANLQAIAIQEEAEEHTETSKADNEGAAAIDSNDVDVNRIDLPDGTGSSILCAGGRGDLDNATASMLAQVLSVTGATVTVAGFTDLEPSRLARLKLDGAETIVISFLNRDSINHARFLVRRLKRLRPNVRVGLVLWSDPEASGPRTPDERDTLATKLNADFVAFSLADAISDALGGSRMREEGEREARE